MKTPHEATLDQRTGTPAWVANATVLWQARRTLVRTALIALLVSLTIAFLWPKQYESSARIMPPASTYGNGALLAALAGRSGGGLGSLSALAGGLLGGGGNPGLFINLLNSGTVSGHLIDRFNLQRAYHKRYRIDTAKYLARHTAIADDKKSGIISLTVTDTDPVRARDIAQGYLDELNKLVNNTNTSSARQERLFLEQRLKAARIDLERAQQRLGEFSSTHSTIDIKEQTHATVEAAAQLQSQLIMQQSSLDGLRQIYGDGNIRVRSAQARIGNLRRELDKIGGSSKALGPEFTRNAANDDFTGSTHDDPYPPLRQLPRLAVPYADLYREVRVQETVYELLTQQYELARIQEAKDIPVVSVIDAPGIPEKKSFPPRFLLALVLALAVIGITCAYLLAHARWQLVPPSDPVKQLVREISTAVHNYLSPRLYWSRTRGAV